MQINSTFFIFFLHSTATFLGVAPDKLDDLRAAVKASNITSIPITTNLSTVFINDQKCIVSVYDPMKVGQPIIEKGEYNDNTLSKLYTCISCEIAIWTANKLFEFLEPFPLKHNALLLDVQNNIFGINYNKLVHILNEITENTKRFINILSNFININTYNKYYETDLLKTLLTLNFKLHFIKKLGDCCYISEVKQEGVEKCINNDIIGGDGNNSDDDSEYGDGCIDEFDYSENVDKHKMKGFDDVVVRIILQTINSIQNFVVLSCNFPPSSNDIIMYDVFLMPKPASRNDGKITDFLADIKELGLESLESCGVKEMLLLGTNVWNWLGIEWKTAKERVRVEDIVKRIEISHDLETIHWYQELIFKTIMKTILSKCQKYDKIFPDGVLRLLKDVHKHLILDFHKLPSAIVEIFTVFNEYEGTKHADLLGKIANYLNSVSEVQLLGKSENNRLLSLSLENLLDLVLKNLDGFRCFVRVFDFLQYEYNKFYVPFKKNSTTIDTFVRVSATESTANEICVSVGQEIRAPAVGMTEKNDMVIDDAGCAYIRGLNHYCFMALFIVNIQHANPSYIDDQIHQEVIGYLMKIYNLLDRLINNVMWHIPLFNTLNRALPLFTIHVIFSAKKLNFYDHYLRLLYAIITELNEYGLHHCRLPEFSFGFYGMNFGLIGRHSLVDDTIGTAEKRIHLFGKTVENDVYKHFDISKFFIQSRIFDMYESIIFIDWKSERMSIKYVCAYMKSTVSRSSVSYAFYDIYVKFFMAFTFYNMKTLYDNFRSGVFGDVKDMFRREIEGVFRLMLEIHRIPDDYQTIVVAVKELSDLAVNKTYKFENEANWIREGDELQQRIIDRFDSIGVSFDLTRDTSVHKNVDVFLENIFKTINGSFEPLSRVVF